MTDAQLVLLILALLSRVASQQATPTVYEEYIMYRNAFSPAECDTIAAIFLQRPPEQDTRTIPLLPNMHDEFRVSRLSRFDDGTLMSHGKLDFIYDRLVRLQQDEKPSPLFAIAGLDLQRPPNSTSDWAGAALRRLHARVGFNMVHEFNSASQVSPQFDWHADAKPGDGKRRSLNINVMLSVPDADFGGGELDVGGMEIGAQQGDMYIYPAAVVHRVRPLTYGRRLTLVIALEEADAAASPAATAPEEEQVAAGAAGGRLRATYFEHVEASFERLVNGALAGVSKVHILHGEFLEGAGRAEEARAAFCRAYVASGVDEAAAHAAQFVRDAWAALNQPGGADLRLAEQYFGMALCIEPENSEAADTLAAVREALALVAARNTEAGGTDVQVHGEL